MLNVILIIIGIILFGFSLYKHVRFLNLTKKISFRGWWIILFVLVTFFFLGYIVFARWLITGTKVTNLNSLQTLVSLIFFFGAIFVVITISLIYSTVKNLIKEREEIQRLQTEKIALLQNRGAELRKEVEGKTKELQEAKTGLEEKLKKHTAILEGNVIELQRMNKLMIGRELRMLELKKEIAALSKKSDSRPTS